MYKKKVGSFGEDIACQYLQKKAYKIIARNVKLSYQELDIVCMLDKKIIFVEVKTRVAFYQDRAEEAMDKNKYANLKKAMLHYLIINKQSNAEFQLDLIAVYLDKTAKKANIKHYIDII